MSSRCTAAFEESKVDTKNNSSSLQSGLDGSYVWGLHASRDFEASIDDASKKPSVIDRNLTGIFDS